MRVMCVKRIETTNSPKGLPPVHIGDTDEVVGQEVWFGYTYYAFARFAKLPEQTADEMNALHKEAILM